MLVKETNGVREEANVKSKTGKSVTEIEDHCKTSSDFLTDNLC